MALAQHFPWNSRLTSRTPDHVTLAYLVLSTFAMRTLKQLAQESLDVQNASNLSGVVHSFARALTELREVIGTSPNTHPISILWADKIAHLTGTQDIGNETVYKAYQAVRSILDAPENAPSSGTLTRTGAV